MARLRVLVADDNPAQRKRLVNILEHSDRTQIIYAAENGVDALRAIEDLRPDAVVTDMVMPKLDGFGLLERVSAMPAAHRPVMIALSALGRDDFIARAVQLGVSDYLIKPVEDAVLLERICTLCGGPGKPASVKAAPPTPPVEHRLQAEEGAHPRREELAQYAMRLLMQLGMPAHLLGCLYLTEAVVLTVQEPGQINHIIRDLYPAVAQRCGSTPARVERAIRNAINITWDRGGGAAFSKLMGLAGPEAAHKPTSGELIAQLAARIRFHETR